MHVSQGSSRLRGLARHTRTMARAAALVVTVSFAVVGIAGPSSAHHNTISGSVQCATGGGWLVTWSVENSETVTETITNSNRTSAVPNGTRIGGRQIPKFTETITTKPTGDVELKLSGRWDNGQTATNSGFTRLSQFTDNCATKKVAAPTVPVTDACGPGNAVYGTVPTGPWTVVRNANGSLTITANPGYVFTNGSTVANYPVPTDSNTPCPVGVPQVPVTDDCGPGNAVYGTVPTGPWTVVRNPDGSITITATSGYAFPDGSTVITYPVPTDSNVACPVVTPPVVNPPEVLPAEVLVVKAKARYIDKCGRKSDLFKVGKSDGIVYRANGKVIRQGKWLRATKGKVTIKAFAVDETYALQGRRTWKLTFSNKSCERAPDISPDTGAK